MKDCSDYYYVYLCLKKLIIRKKVTKNVANKVLKIYEERYHPVYKHYF